MIVNSYRPDMLPTLRPSVPGNIRIPSESKHNNHGKLRILLQCPKWWDCSFPVRQLVGTFKRFPKNVPMMFWHGTFEMFLAISQLVGLWCSQPVKFKMNRNNGIEVCQNGIFGMSPLFSPECTTFGIFLGNYGNIAVTLKTFPVFLVVRATLP